MTNSSHPNLRRKLEFLYNAQCNPKINNNADLAKALGVSRQAVSKWINGSGTTRGNRVPREKLGALADLFGLKPNWIALTYEEFSSRITTHLEQDMSMFQSPASQLQFNVSTMPTTEDGLFGRDAELLELDAALNNRTLNLMQIIGFGGLGKSSLVNGWLHRLRNQDSFAVSKIFAWSFDWQGSGAQDRSSADYFIESALTWLGEADAVNTSGWNKVNRLAELVREQRTVLVLDGLESQLESPMHNKPRVKDPNLDLLLKELAISMNGLCVLTSRIALDEMRGSSNGRVATMELSPLSLASSISMLRARGLEGLDAQLEPLAEQISGHPLSLSLIAGYLNIACSGDINKLNSVKLSLEQASSDDMTQRIMANYIDWLADSPGLHILYLLVLSSSRCSIAELMDTASQLGDSKIAGKLVALDLPDWLLAVEKLKKAGLVAVMGTDVKAQLDCHLLVREYLARVLETEYEADWIAGHSLIFDSSKDSLSRVPESMKDLESYLDVIRHGCLAGRYEESFDLYSRRIKQGQTSVSPLGSHQSDLDCLRFFFRRRWTDPLDELPLQARFFLISSAAANLLHTGRIYDALTPLRMAIRGLMDAGEWTKAALALAPAAAGTLAAGLLDEYDEIQELATSCVKNSGDPVLLAGHQSFSSWAEYRRGNYSEAEALLKKADKVFMGPAPSTPITFPLMSYFQTQFLLERGDPEAALERAKLVMAWRENDSWHYSYDTNVSLAFDHLVLGGAYLKTGKLELAETSLDKGVAILEAAGSWTFLAMGLNYRSKFFLAEGDYISALVDLKKAGTISRRCNARVHEWESYLLQCQVYQQLGDRNKAMSNYKRFKDQADTDNYRFMDEQIEEVERYLFGEQ